MSVLIFIVLGSGVFLYYQGPHYGLEKAKVLAKSEFGIEIQYKQAGFIGKQGFYINELEIKKQKLNFSVQHFEVFGNINLTEKHVEIFEILLDHPSIRGEITSDETETPLAETKSDEPSSLENLIINPPAQIKLHRIKFKSLLTQISLLKKTRKGILQKTDITMSEFDFDTDLDLIPGKFKQQIHLQTSKPLQIERTEGDSHQLVELAQLKVDLATTIKKSEIEGWVYEAIPIDLEAMLTRLEMKSDFNLTGKESHIKLISEVRLRSSKLFNFEPLQIDKLQWDLDSYFRKIQGTGKPAFSFLYKSGAEIKIESKGHLFPAKAQPTRFDLPWTWDASFKVLAGPFHLEGVKTNFRASGQWNDNKGRFVVETKPTSLLKFQGATELQKQQLQLDGHLEANVPSSVAESLIHQNFEGTLKMPIHLLILPAGKPNFHDISFETVLEFANFNFNSPKVNIGGLNGQIPITEQIMFDSSAPILSGWSFKNLFTQNPFERVDYERLDPLVRSSDMIRIENIQWEGRSFGPMRGVMDLEQNLVSVHSFAMNFGEGSANGELFVDLHPKNQRVGFLGRLTQLDLGQILPKRYLSGAKVTDSLPFSARTGVVFSVKRKSLDGRMDVTQIGGPQLTVLINVLDPNYENEKMNKVRSLLQVGYPTAVNVGFHEGALDLAVDIEAMGLKTHQRLPGISIQSFIDRALREKMNPLTE